MFQLLSYLVNDYFLGNKINFTSLSFTLFTFLCTNKCLLGIVLEYSVYFSFFLGITGHWSSRVERAGVVSRVQMAEYRKYIRLGSLGANSDLC